jgi:copper chaperone CopZ
MQKRRVIGFVMLALIMTLSVSPASAADATVTVRIEGMHCGNCAASVTKKLKATKGVQDVRVSFEKKEAVIKYDDQKVTVAELRAAINSTGFKALEDDVSKTSR